MGENGNGAMPAIKSINQHTKKSTLDWAYNMLVQPDNGAGRHRCRRGVEQNPLLRVSLCVDSFKLGARYE